MIMICDNFFAKITLIAQLSIFQLRKINLYVKFLHIIHVIRIVCLFVYLLSCDIVLFNLIK